MSLAATTVIEVRATGSDLNGGGFVTGASGIDYSQQDAAQWALTGLTCAAGGTVVSDDNGSAALGMVGNLIQIAAAGTHFVSGFYQITAVAVGVSFTLDRTPTDGSAASGGTGNIGGALATPGAAGRAISAVAGADVYIKSGTYTITSTGNNANGACVTLPAAASVNNVTKLIGYTNTRGDGAPTRPIIQTNGVITAFTFLTLAQNTRVENIEFNGNARASSRGINANSQNNTIYNCVFRNMTNGAVQGNSLNRTAVIGCWATGCSTVTAFVDGIYLWCVASGNSIGGFSSAGNLGAFVRCIAANNTGAATDGFSFGAAGQAINCTGYGNGRHGFNVVGNNNPIVLMNCLSVGNGASGTGYGFSGTAAPHDNAMLYNCASYNNASGHVDATILPAANQVAFLTLTADPFVNAAGGNFGLNNTAGGGAVLRGAAAVSAFPGISTSGYGDVGAAQHQDAAGGGASLLASTLIQREAA